MLGSKNKNNPRNSGPSNTPGLGPDAGSTCVISQGTEMEGNFSSKENVRLDGTLKGEIKCDQRIVMGESGKIEGTLNANEAVILGYIKGDVVISGSLSLKATAKIEGNITAKLLSVEEGATYNGTCKIGTKG